MSDFDDTISKFAGMVREEWGAWSDREIARRCRVGAPLVGTLRAEVAHTVSSYSVERTFVHPKTGAPTTMNTANIGQIRTFEFRLRNRRAGGRS